MACQPETQPVNVWFGYTPPKLMKVFPFLLVVTAVTTPSTQLVIGSIV